MFCSDQGLPSFKELTKDSSYPSRSNKTDMLEEDIHCAAIISFIIPISSLRYCSTNIFVEY
jgi:hypothetical protein